MHHPDDLENVPLSREKDEDTNPTRKRRQRRSKTVTTPVNEEVLLPSKARKKKATSSLSSGHDNGPIHPSPTPSKEDEVSGKC